MNGFVIRQLTGWFALRENAFYPGRWSIENLSLKEKQNAVFSTKSVNTSTACLFFISFSALNFSHSYSVGHLADLF